VEEHQVNDQDFFFDEDEQPKNVSAKPAAKKSAASAPKGAAVVVAAPAGEQSVSMTVTALVGVIAILLGVIIGIFIGRGLAAPAGVAATGTGGAPAAAGQAPQLSPEQLNSGQLPPGHPNIGGGAASGSKDATGK
jgi:hypothetical protein